MKPDFSKGKDRSDDGKMPDPLRRAIRIGNVEELDTRPVFEAGREPFRIIMDAVDRLPAGSVFHLIVPFEPVPLHAVMAGRGFVHWKRAPEPGAAEAWEIYYYPAAVGSGENKEAREPGTGEITGDEDGDLLELDVRGLAPPEPLEQIMQLVESLTYGQVARVRHHRHPHQLIPFLQERDFAWLSRETDTGEWEIRIWRKD